MPADLQIHSTFSDGSLTPAEVVTAAREAGLTVIALTDHDSVEGIEPAREVGEREKVRVIPGVELSTERDKREVHILGYFIDYRAGWLNELLQRLQEARHKRIYRIVEKLTGMGIEIDLERVLAIAGQGSAGRPHVAQAMVEAGIVDSVPEAFNRYLNNQAPAYVFHAHLEPRRAIELIKQAGGLAVLAHPGISQVDEFIPELDGLDGLEVYYSGHSEEQTRHYLRMAQKYGLLITGGSDYHGPGSLKPVTLGVIKLPDRLVEALEEAWRKR